MISLSVKHTNNDGSPLTFRRLPAKKHGVVCKPNFLRVKKILRELLPVCDSWNATCWMHSIKAANFRRIVVRDRYGLF